MITVVTIGRVFCAEERCTGVITSGGEVAEATPKPKHICYSLPSLWTFCQHLKFNIVLLQSNVADFSWVSQ